MDNAPKALLIAGGMLIALLIISLLLFGYQKIIVSSRTSQESITATQVAEFNSQFEAYNRDDITGFELISLINKVIDYNELNGTEGYLMTITVKITKRQTNLFTQSTYTASTIDGTTSNKKTNLISIITAIKTIEKKSPVSMSDMVDKLTTIENKYNNNTGIANGYKWGTAIVDTFNLKNASTKDTDYPSKNEINQYADYLEFKRGNYSCTVGYNENNGRIDLMNFIQK